ncbi:helix-turn-helix domain-containing protein [Amycolatopsis sp. lyj-84]|uniref:helix-turn-helix domain-containing protein n=1 Tax=Amycolatopsis sp. lyj-84 TaxID=2789284 RepID=UPI0039788909
MSRGKGDQLSTDTAAVEALWTPGELASFLRIPEKTLRNWRSEGESGPPWMKVGRHARYAPAEVRAWLAKLTSK